MIQAFSVIVPVLNKENEITRTLESVEASIQYFYQHYDGTHPVEAEIVVVNEGSNDRTLERVTAFSQDKPHCKIVNHFTRVGAGAARNTGAKVAKGDILFFCDGDDLYFPEHIYLCFQILNHDPLSGSPTSLDLPTNQGPKHIELPNQRVGVLRTGVLMQEQVHPYWKAAIENSLPQNICVRRECHEFVEGFPEAQFPYNQTGCEDISYGTWLTKFFKVLKINLETVEYIRYPGNNFDRQLQKFQTAPDQYQEEMSPETKALHTVRHKIEQDHLTYLSEKLKRVEKTPEFLALLTCAQLGADYLAQNQFQDAIPLLEYSFSQEPEKANHRNLLAAAYNNQGSWLRGQGNLEQSCECFRKAVAMHPSFSNIDLAKLHFNIAASLRDQKRYEEALSYLQKALELEPNLAEAQADFLKLAYYAQVAQRGYQFSQDWFSFNLPVWQQYLTTFVHIPDLRVLEIGSWEGRSTCWLLDHVLTHPTARITCVDLFEGGAEHKLLFKEEFLQTIEQRFDFNVTQAGVPEKVRKMVGASQTVLRSLIPNSYHLAYIDGSHVASDVLEDALLTWRLVKIGGLIIFDDYGYVFPEGVNEDPPRVAIDAFMSIFKKKIKVIHQGYQIFIEKIAD
jgi:glycosyltransferase involved in cell wall biosynthesis